MDCLILFNLWDKKNNFIRIQHIELNGHPLKNEKMYRVVGGGAQILKEHQQNRKPLGLHAHDALKEYFASQTSVSINEEQRIVSI